MKLSLFDQAIRAAVAPTARGITRTGACTATGNDRIAQNDEPELFSEAELIASDRNRNADKAQFLQARDDDALLEQVQRMRAEGAL